MSDYTKVAKIEWTTTEQHSGYFRVPVDFDQNDYVMSEVLADHDEDTFEYCERGDFEVYDTGWPSNMDEAIDLDLGRYRVR